MEERLRSGYAVLGCGRRGSLAGALLLLEAVYTSVSDARKELCEIGGEGRGGEGRGEICHSYASKNYRPG